MSETSNLELLAADPDAIAGKIVESLGKLRDRDEFSSELVYSPFGKHSYYRDFLAIQTRRVDSPGAEERLDMHAEQMQHIHARRQARVERLERSGVFGFERRVTPGRTDGLGGYFSPPAWLNQLFATANRPGRILAGLIPQFPLPAGVSTVNIPILATGTKTQTAADDAAVADQDLTDQAGTSAVVPIAGQQDIGIQLLEQSPAGAAADWAIFMDLSEDYDYQLEYQLITGTDAAQNVSSAQLPGLFTLGSTNPVTYTDASPTGKALDPFMGQAFAKIGDNRLKPPQCWLMRSSRWAWFMTQEDSGNRPFGLDTRFYIGNDDNTPDPISGLLGIPVFLDDAIPANLSGNPGAFVGGGGTQDCIVCLRPHDMLLLETEPRTIVDRESLSGSMGIRLQMHCYAAAITGRRPAGISLIGGTGLAAPSGF